MRLCGWATLVALLMVAGCADRAAEREAVAQRKMERAKDLEDSLDRLDEAIAAYLKVAEDHSGTQASRAAGDRHRGLKVVRELARGLEGAEDDSLKSIYGRMLENVPDYGPVVKKLASIYHNESYLLARTASMMQHRGAAQRVMVLWNTQDSLWMSYPFRATTDDRLWRDRLCEQAVDAARALEAVNRYRDALNVVSRGLSYAAGESAISRAKVYAAVCTYNVGDYASAVSLAKEALSYEGLSTEDQARVHHTMGLCYTYIFTETEELSDLDAAIRATNESMNLVPTGSAKDLLRQLRKQRQRL